MKIQVCYLSRKIDKKVLTIVNNVPIFTEMLPDNPLPIIFKNDITIDDINIKYGTDYTKNDYRLFYFELANIKYFNH